MQDRVGRFGRRRHTPGMTGWASLLAAALLMAAPAWLYAADLDLCGCANSESIGDFNTIEQGSEAWQKAKAYRSADGHYVVIPLPEDGVLVFDSLTVTQDTNSTSGALKFERNAANTPVTLLVKGDVWVTSGRFGAYHISVNGEHGPNFVAGQGVAGLPGPGGFTGGAGAHLATGLGTDGVAGIGPEGGLGGSVEGGTKTVPGGGTWVGVPELRPLVGGSGGGGGYSSQTDSDCWGGGGGGGGGAILIVANGKIRLDADGGAVRAIGGNGGARGSADCSSSGGGGSGGAIRLVARQVTGSGRIYADGGDSGNSGGNHYPPLGATGSPGSIRIEVLDKEDLFPGTTSPDAIRTTDIGPLVNPASPAVVITQIGEEPVPEGMVHAGSVGGIDMTVEAAGDVAFQLESSDVPSGTLLEVKATPTAGGAPKTSQQAIASGDCTGGDCTTTVALALSPGAYIVEARATFQVPAP